MNDSLWRWIAQQGVIALALAYTLLSIGNKLDSMRDALIELKAEMHGHISTSTK